METLIVTLLLIGMLVMMFQSSRDDAAVAAANAAPYPPNNLEYIETVTVTVDDPSELVAAIDEVHRDKARGGLFTSGYTVGAPQITSDGLTAYISLFR